MPGSPTHRLRWLLAGAVLLSTGCGSGTYEYRLQQTAEWYRHLNLRNELLANPAWKSASVEYYRPPRQFTLLEPPADAEGPDPRQPPFLNQPLPGLIGAWQADVALEGGDQTAPAWIYLLSNYQDFCGNAAQKKAALNFLRGVGIRLNGQLGGHLGNADVPSLQEGFDRLQGAKYVEEIRCSQVNRSLSGLYAGIDYEFRAYGFSEKDVQVALLAFYPQNAGRADNLDRAILLSLETLRITGELPQCEGPPTADDGGGDVEF